MADRLAETAPRALPRAAHALQELPLTSLTERVQATRAVLDAVGYGDLLAVAKAARDAADSLAYLVDYPHQPDCGAWNVFCATCYGLIVRDEIRAALANLEGGAT